MEIANRLRMQYYFICDTVQTVCTLFVLYWYCMLIIVINGSSDPECSHSETRQHVFVFIEFIKFECAFTILRRRSKVAYTEGKTTTLRRSNHNNHIKRPSFTFEKVGPSKSLNSFAFTGTKDFVLLRSCNFF